MLSVGVWEWRFGELLFGIIKHNFSVFPPTSAFQDLLGTVCGDGNA